MPAWKALLFVIVLGLIVATGAFAVMPDMRPPFVQRMFLQAQGFGPAKTPNEALDKFKNAIRQRNYTAAATLCGGEYAEELKKCAKKAELLSNSVDDLVHNVENVANINSPRGKFVLRRIRPFVADFKVLDIKQQGDDTANAMILLDDGNPIGITANDLSEINNYNVDPRIVLSVTPQPWNGRVELKYENTDGGKAWRIHLPVSSYFREKVTFLRDNGGNYVRALDNIKYAIKHEAATKLDFEEQLKRQLAEAK